MNLVHLYGSIQYLGHAEVANLAAAVEHVAALAFGGGHARTVDLHLPSWRISPNSKVYQYSRPILSSACSPEIE